MSYKVDEKEFASVILLQPDMRYSYFLNKVADWEEVWSIGNDEGWVLMAYESEVELVPVWPAEIFAKACCNGEWKNCSPISIPLRAFIDKWIPGIENDGRKIAVFPIPNGEGIVLPAFSLLSEINVTLEQIE